MKIIFKVQNKKVLSNKAKYVNDILVKSEVLSGLVEDKSFGEVMDLLPHKVIYINIPIEKHFETMRGLVVQGETDLHPFIVGENGGVYDIESGDECFTTQDEANVAMDCLNKSLEMMRAEDIQSLMEITHSENLKNPK